MRAFPGQCQTDSIGVNQLHIEFYEEQSSSNYPFGWEGRAVESFTPVVQKEFLSGVPERLSVHVVQRWDIALVAERISGARNHKTLLKIQSWRLGV